MNNVSIDTKYIMRHVLRYKEISCIIENSKQAL